MKATRCPVLFLAIAAIGSMTACSPAHRAEVAIEEIDSGNAAACVEERSTIEKAVEAYTLLNPTTPPTEATMVADGFIRRESKLMDISAAGAVVAAPGTVCT